MVNVGIYPEQPAEDRSANLQEIGREADSDLLREDSLIVKLCLCPGHQGFNVGGGGQGCRPFTESQYRQRVGCPRTMFRRPPSKSRIWGRGQRHAVVTEETDLAPAFMIGH